MIKKRLMAFATAMVLISVTSNIAWGQTSATYEMSNRLAFSTGVDDSKWYTLTSYSEGTTFGDNEYSADSAIGFPFAFNGATYHMWSYTTNGEILLAAPHDHSSSMADSALTIRVCNADMEMSTSEGNYVHYQLFGTAPNRTLVVEYCFRSYQKTGNWTTQVQMAEQGSLTIIYGSSSLDVQPNAFTTGLYHYTNLYLIPDSNYATHPLRNNLFYSVSTTTHTCAYAMETRNTLWPGNYRYYTFTNTDTKCHVVDSLQLTAATPTSLTLSWKDDNNSGAEYLLRSNTPTTSTTSTTTSYTFTDLMPDTNYYVAVMAKCDADRYSEPMKIRLYTPCHPMAENLLPYNQHTWTEYDYNLPSCWTLLYSMSGTYIGDMDLSTQLSWQMGNYMQIEVPHLKSVASVITVLPQIAIATDSRRAITFLAKAELPESQLEVGVISNLAAPSSFQTVATYTVGHGISTEDYTWITQDVSTALANGSIALRFSSTLPNADCLMRIDSVSVYIPYTVQATANNPLWGTATYSKNMLTAEATEGYTFINWSDTLGNTLGTTNPMSVAITSDTAFVAVFDTMQYTVSPLVAAACEGMGSVTAPHLAKHFLTDTLVATPALGYRLAYWSNGATTDTLLFTPTQDTHFVAYFTLDTFNIAISSNNTQWGDVAFLDIRDKWGDGISNFIPTLPLSGISVTIEANGDAEIYSGGLWWATDGDADSYFRFSSTIEPITRIELTLRSADDTLNGAGWTLNNGIALWTGNAMTVDLPACTAFVKKVLITYANSLLINATEDTARVVYPTLVPLQATPKTHYHLVDWTDNIGQSLGTYNMIGITATSDTAIQANFAPDTFAISLAVDANQLDRGSVAFKGSDLTTLCLAYLTDTVIMAIPNYGYLFSQWNDGNTDNPRTITDTAMQTYTASFVPDTFTVVLCANDTHYGHIVYAINDTISWHTPTLSPLDSLLTASTSPSAETQGIALRLPYLTRLALKATEKDPCYSFVHWTTLNAHDTLGTTPALRFAITADTSVLALFKANLYLGDTTAIACDSFAWHDSTYTLTPTTAPTHIYATAAHGCDSTVSLNLTVNHQSQAIDTHTRCNTYTWIDNRTFTESTDTATHTFPGGNHYGCDSLLTLHLTINHTTYGSFTAQADVSYEWLNETFTADGEYTRTITNTKGCDSVVTLTLSIMPNTTPIPTIYSLMDRLLVINHNPDPLTNIHYSYYRWYRNGVVVKEGPDADSYDEGGALLNGCYYLEVSTSPSLAYWVHSTERCFGTLGIEAADSELGFTLAPNPAAQGTQVVLAVDADETLLQHASLRIFDTRGSVVMEIPNGIPTMHEAHLARGTYLVQLRLADGRKATRKLIIQ